MKDTTHTRRVWTPELIDQLRELAEAGEATLDISLKLEFSTSSVLQKIREHGIKRPARRKPVVATAPSETDPAPYALYQGEPKAYMAPGSQQFLSIPSRRGNRRFYRDGRVEIVKEKER